MAQETECQTPGATFYIEIINEWTVSYDNISVVVDLPQGQLKDIDADILEKNLQTAVESVLAPYFKSEEKGS